MTDKLAALIRKLKDKHEQDPVAYGSWCNADCCGPWPCDAIRLVEAVEDLAKAILEMGQAAQQDCLNELPPDDWEGHELVCSAEHQRIRATTALTRAEERLAR
jgi:hypothetical protein